MDNSLTHPAKSCTTELDARHCGHRRGDFGVVGRLLPELGGEEDTPPAVTYDLNRLQGLTTPDRYCVTLNPREPIDDSRVLRRFVYRHPLYNAAGIFAQRRWSEVSGVNRTHYCGAYWGYGFHEDGLNSALRVARTLGVRW